MFGIANANATPPSAMPAMTAFSPTAQASRPQVDGPGSTAGTAGRVPIGATGAGLEIASMGRRGGVVVTVTGGGDPGRGVLIKYGW